MEPKPFAGIFPYLVSPVDDQSGHVKDRVLGGLVEHLISAGVHGLSPLGSTGEYAFLTFEQRIEIVRTLVDAAAKRVPVVPAVAAFSTMDAIRQAGAFVNLGADGLIVILQTMFPLSRQEIEHYFEAVARAVLCPIVLYTNPALGTADLTPDMILTLSDVPNIRYVKDASGITGRILTILNRAAGRMSVFAASAHIPLLVFMLGGVGWMAGPASIIPGQCVRLYDLYRAGQLEQALALQKRLWPINELFQKYSLAACIKAGLQLQGFDIGTPIPPQRHLPGEAFEEIRRALEEMGRAEAQ